MKNTFKVLGITAILAAIMFSVVLTGCATISKENYGSFPVIAVPAKDFNSLGLIFTENVISNNNGQVFTYYELLKLAKELGGDAIINVTIDVKNEGLKFLWFNLNQKETWYGSAIAIKYLPGTLKEVTMSDAGSGDGNSSDSGIASSGKKSLFKPSTWFK